MLFHVISLNLIADLCLSGLPAPRNLSAKDKARLDEQRILEDLRNEGLIATSKFQAKSGLAFEVVEATTMPRRAVPARLASIEKKKKKKKTKEEIAEKLARAEKRRKVGIWFHKICGCIAKALTRHYLC